MHYRLNDFAKIYLLHCSLQYTVLSKLLKLPILLIYIKIKTKSNGLILHLNNESVCMKMKNG